MPSQLMFDVPKFALSNNARLLAGGPYVSSCKRSFHSFESSDGQIELGPPISVLLGKPKLLIHFAVAWVIDELTERLQ